MLIVGMAYSSVTVLKPQTHTHGVNCVVCVISQRSCLKKKKVAIKLPYDPAIPLLGLHQRELKTSKACVSQDSRSVERTRFHQLTSGEVKRGIKYGYRLHMGFPHGSDGKSSTCSAIDPGSFPGWGRSPGEENGNPLQYPCLETPWTAEPGGLRSMGSQEPDGLSNGSTTGCTRMKPGNRLSERSRTAKASSGPWHFQKGPE